MNNSSNIYHAPLVSTIADKQQRFSILDHAVPQRHRKPPDLHFWGWYFDTSTLFIIFSLVFWIRLLKTQCWPKQLTTTLKAKI